MASFVERLSKLGPVVTLPQSPPGRWSVLRPDCIDVDGLAADLPASAQLRSAFFKVRLFELPGQPRLLIAPMCFAEIAFPTPEQPLAASDFERTAPHLAELLAIQERHLRKDLDQDVRLHSQYDMFSFHLDLLLLEAFAQHLAMPVTLEKTSLRDYYGPHLSGELLDAVSRRLAEPRAATMNSPAEHDDLPATLAPITTALIKAATLTAYESANASVANRADWSRAGLTFDELVRVTHLSPDALSIGIDMLADAGLTESYNRLRRDADGRVTVDRALNSLSDEFLAIVAAFVARLKEAKERHPTLAISTSLTTLNKFFALFFSLRGCDHVDITYNKQGKTVWLRLDTEKGREYDVTLRALVEIGKEDFEITSAPAQVALTPAGLAKDWVTHTPNVREQHAVIDYTTQLWIELAEELEAARSRGESSAGRTAFDLFSALVDSVGARTPEWGITTIAHLLEWAVDAAVKGDGEDVQTCLNSVEHKIRVLRDGHGVLAQVYGRRVAGRLNRASDNDLVERVAILPKESLILDTLHTLCQVTTQVITAGRTEEMRQKLRYWTWLFHAPTERASEAGAILRLPAEMPDGFVVFVDLVPMKRLGKMGFKWPLSSVGQLAPRWARLCRATGGKTLSDALAVGFTSAQAAVRFAAGVSIHLNEVNVELGKALGIDVFMQAAVVKGQLEIFKGDFEGEREVTGKALARVADTRARNGFMRVDRLVWDEIVSDGVDGVRPEGEPDRDGFLELSAAGLFRRMILDRMSQAGRAAVD